MKMKKLIALLLIALVVAVSGCTLQDGTNQTGGNQTANPLSEDFGSADNPEAGSPPPMPELPGAG